MTLLLKNICIISFLVSSIQIYSQIDAIKYLKTINGKYTMISTDELGNLFTINGNQINKYNINGNLIYTYSNFYAGDISYLNTGDPFKIFLFYTDFSQIEILDNTLSPVEKIDLSPIGQDLATLACPSYESGFWVFNPPFLELIRFNQYIEITDRTGNIFKATGYEINPNYLIESDNTLYLYDPQNGILVFDKFGTFFRNIAVDSLFAIQVFDHKLIYCFNDSLIILDPETLDSYEHRLPESNIDQIRLSIGSVPKRLYTLKSGTVKLYSVD